MLKYNPKIKICGINNTTDAQYSAKKGADMLGFIFYDKSPRYINPIGAQSIIAEIKHAKSVGVFVNQPVDEVNKIANKCDLDFVQLHGTESPEYCKEINKPIIKAIHITPDISTSDVQKLVDKYEMSTEYYLFDSKVNGLWGGTGKAFNNLLLNELQINKNYFIAGGISNDNVKRIISQSKPYAIDISSSLELKPGVKDHKKIDAFFEEVTPKVL